MRFLLALCLLCGFAASSPVLFAGGSPTIKKKSTDTAVADYNKGTKLLFAGQYDDAIPHFRAALKTNSKLAEAHNNLAFCLRKKGEKHFAEALKHYNKAISLASKLPEPYMYRGVLYVQMGKTDLAQADLAKLESMQSPLAAELDWVIKNGKEKEPDQFFGVTKAKDA